MWGMTPLTNYDSSVVTNYTQGPQKYHTTGNSCRDALPRANMALKLPWFFTYRWRSLLAATSKFGLLTIRWHNATRKHLFPNPQGD